MFFTISKAFSFFLIPSNDILLAVVVGTLLVFTRWRRAGRRILVTAVAVLFIVAVSPFSLMLMKILEDRFPAWNDTRGAPTGFIILGGAVDPTGSALRKTIQLGDGAERLTIVAELARKYPAAKIIYSGGNGALRGGPAEADAVLPLFESFGIAKARIMLERESRNTAENAVFSKVLAAPKPGDRWVLITSALHMPRSIGSFRAAGFDVEAYPVDWQTTGLDIGLTFSNSFLSSLYGTDQAAHEYVGLLTYWLTGRSSEFFPAPR